MSNSPFSISLLAQIIAGRTVLPDPDAVIFQLVTDSRNIRDAAGALFLAIRAQRNGHDFIPQAYEAGVRNFVVSQETDTSLYPGANFIFVADTLRALQQLAAFRRSLFRIPVIGITGSNGKTIVKEWLYQLLHEDYDIVRSPMSYNSQIGVPLSVWQMSDRHNLAVFEAGISTRGEMEALEAIIQPDIGILTNIGEAHNQGFDSKKEKLTEKLKLFTGAEWFIYSPDYTGAPDVSALPGKKKFSWSTRGPADLQVTSIKPSTGSTQIEALYRGEQHSCIIPFSDKASIENALICWATLLVLGYSPAEAVKRLGRLTGVDMRLTLISGIENCSVIDDSYSADSSSLAIALDFLNLQNQHPQKTVILSDLLETGKTKEVLYAGIASLLRQKGVDRFIGIGENLSAMANLFPADAAFYPDTDAFIAAFPDISFANEAILIKGARRFEFERISKLLTLKTHNTVLEVHLNALAHNLNHYRSLLKPGVKTMAMVKAFSYGSGSYEIANLLQYQKVDYLAVAYADEGVALRKAGIRLPLMVMSPDPAVFEAMIRYGMAPEIYNIPVLKSFMHFLPDHVEPFNIHLKLDTGMHRLGFGKDDLPELLQLLLSEKIKVESVFTHLVASDEAKHDAFTAQQLARFDEMYAAITAQLGYQPLRHALNTSGISRFPDAQMDMVRIGIGLYGFDSAARDTDDLQTVLMLKTTVSQVTTLPVGETVGYGRSGTLPAGGTIATVKIGYADGYDRRFGNGVGKMMIRGRLVPTVGSICMDMCMLDVSGIEVRVGDEVIVFDAQHSIATLAAQIGTIPYEILTSVSQRVKRVYFY